MFPESRVDISLAIPLSHLKEMNLQVGGRPGPKRYSNSLTSVLHQHRRGPSDLLCDKGSSSALQLGLSVFAAM